MDAEHDVATQNFDAPVIKVEDVMRDYGRGVDWSLLLVGICICEVGQAGNTDGRRLGERGFRNGVWVWGSGRFGLGGLRNLRFRISGGKSQGCDNWSRVGVFLVRAGRFWFPGSEYG